MTNTSDNPAIFLAFANEQGLEANDGYLRNLPAESNALQSILEPLDANKFKIIPRTNATSAILFKTLREYHDRLVLFHFAGHANSYALYLEPEFGQQQSDAEGLAEFLKARTNLQFVFLNACSTKFHAQALLDAGIPSILVTSRAIDDGAACAFATYFYQSLVTGASLQEAFQEAQGQMRSVWGNNPRQLYREGTQETTDQWPWLLVGSEKAKAWSFADALNDPTFGLPSLPNDIGLPNEPYRNLNRFTRESARVFYGRGQDIRSLFQAIINETPGSDRIVLLYGQSGVGKSSVLEAGVLPRLESAMRTVYVRHDPKYGLLDALEQAVFELLGMSTSSLTDCWSALRELNRPVVLVIDQLEEAFSTSTANGQAELEALFDALSRVLQADSSPLHFKIVLGFRKEILAEVEDALRVRGWSYTTHFLKTLSKSNIIEAINGSSLHAKYAFSIEPALLGLIADDLLADPYSPIAPTLQILMDRLITDARHANLLEIRQSQYDNLRRPGKLFERFFDDNIELVRLNNPEAVESGLVFDLLEFHTTPRGASKQRNLEEIRQHYSHRHDVLDIVESICQVRLLVDTEPIDGQPARRLAHDTLGSLVRERFEVSERSGQRARRILKNQVMEWASELRTLPLNQRDLGLVEEGRMGMRTWTMDELRLVQTSRHVLISQNLLMQSQTTGIGDDLKLLLLLEALRLEESPSNFGHLLAGLQSLDTRLIQLLHGIQEPCIGLAVSPDGSNLSVIGLNGTVCAWDLFTGKLSRTLPLRFGILRKAVFDANGKVALLTRGEKIQIAEVATGNIIWEAESVHVNPIENIAYSKGWLASSDGTATAYLWDSNNPSRPRYPIDLSPNSISAIGLTSDGRVLGLGTKEGRVFLWDIDRKKQMGQVLSGHGGSVTNLVFSPSGTFFATSSRDQSVVVWDIRTPKTVRRMLKGIRGQATCLAFSPNGKWLVIGIYDGNLRLFNVFEKDALGIILERHNESVSHVVFTADSSLLISTGKMLPLRVWQPNHDNSVWQGESVDGLTFDVQGVLWVLSRNEQKLNFYDAKRKRLVREILTEALAKICLSPDAKLIATVNQNQKLELWDTLSGFRIQHTELSELPSAMTFHPDGQFLALGHSSGTIQIIDLENGFISKIVQAHDGSVDCLVFSPISMLLASGGEDCTIHLWDMIHGQQIGHDLEGHVDPVSTLAFNQDGTILASGSWDKSIRLWDIASKRLLGKPLRGHSEGVSQIAFSADSQWLASGGWDAKIRLWHVPSGQAVGGAFEGHGSVVTHLAVDLENRWFVSGSKDGTVREWAINPVLWKERARHIANRDLTQAEWAEYVGDLPFKVQNTALTDNFGIEPTEDQ